MTYQTLLIIQWISVVVLAIESVYVFMNIKTKGQSYLFLFCFATMINNAAYTLVMQSRVAEEGSVASRLSYVGKVWIPLTFLVVVFDMCEVKVKGWIYSLLFTIHLSVMFLVLTSDKHNFFYSADRKFVETDLFPHNVYGHTFIYNAYMVLCVIYVIIGLTVIVRRYIQDNDKHNRHLYLYMALAVLAMVGGLLGYLFHLTNGYDSTALGYSITSIIMVIAIFKYKLMDTLSIVRDYVIDTMSEGIIATDRTGKVIYYNEAMRSIFEDIDIDSQEAVNVIKKRIKNAEMIHHDDDIFSPVQTPLLHNNHKKGDLYVLTNVTASYRYMQELKEQKELAERANESKTAFLSVVSHEIRTPMSAIVGMTDLILEEADQLGQRNVKYLQNIKNSGDALVMIVNDILDQSKIEAGKMEIVEDVYELRPMTDDVRLIIENRIGSKPVELIYDIDERIPKFLVGDSLRIRQILINLLNNAVKFTEEGFIKLTIKLVGEENNKKRLEFAVRDSGQGIKPEDLEKIGQAFVQVDTKKNHMKEGTGLGLSISRDFISMMGGQLNVVSRYGEGTEFYFAICQGVTKGMENSNVNINKQAWQQDDKFKAPDAKILVVDDTEINLTIFKELLRPIETEIITANSGEKAIELVKTNRFNAIFMDYMMPYMDGIETVTYIRNLSEQDTDAENAEYYRTVPIIALSGDSNDSTVEAFVNAGIDDYMVKPVDVKRLKKMLIKWLPKEYIKRV